MNFSREKEIQTTPELLGHALQSVVLSDLKQIAKSLEEDNVSLDGYQWVEILQQVFVFYYSVFLLVIGTRYPSVYESTGSELDYASLFLEEAGRLKIIAAIEDPPVIVRILIHLGLPTHAPPRAPAQRFDLFQTA